MTEWDQDIQGAVKQALRLHASGSWRTLERLGSQARGVDHSPVHALLSALCINPLQEPEKGRDNLTALAAVAPRSACSLALGRSLLALAQEQILTSQRARAEVTVRQALACSAEAAAAMGLFIPTDLPDQLFSQAGVLVQTLASQLELELARRRQQLPAQLVLVLGMHRSGTSALAGLLVESGLDGPADPMPATPANPKGYFESMGAMHLNDSLLAALGSEWCSSDLISEARWTKSAPAVETWRSGMLKLLHSAYPRGGRAVLKDPRLCILLPGIRSWLESNLLPCVAFLPIRPPAEVVESLWIAEAIPRSLGLILWIRHIFESERHSRGIKRLIVPYHRLIEEPDAILRCCHETLAEAPRWDGLKSTSMTDAAGFIDPELRRQRAGSGMLEWVSKEKSEDLYDFAQQIYALIAERKLSQNALQARMDEARIQMEAFFAQPLAGQQC